MKSIFYLPFLLLAFIFFSIYAFFPDNKRSRKELL